MIFTQLNRVLDQDYELWSRFQEKRQSSQALSTYSCITDITIIVLHINSEQKPSKIFLRKPRKLSHEEILSLNHYDPHRKTHRLTTILNKNFIPSTFQWLTRKRTLKPPSPLSLPQRRMVHRLSPMLNVQNNSNTMNLLFRSSNLRVLERRSSSSSECMDLLPNHTP